MLLLPGEYPGVIRMGPLSLAEEPSVDARSTRGAGLCGAGLVEHLVEDDEFHDERGDRQSIEGSVDSDRPGVVVVDAELDAVPSASGGGAPPADPCVDGPGKASIVEPIEDRFEVMDRPARFEVRPGRRWTDVVSVVSDERVEKPSRLAACSPASREVREGLRDGLVGGEKHVVDPETHAIRLAAIGDHRGAIVMDL